MNELEGDGINLPDVISLEIRKQLQHKTKRTDHFVLKIMTPKISRSATIRKMANVYPQKMNSNNSSFILMNI
ncbi:hypothetical protein V1477_011524 [Vespula maculifrons]|uniref:Uncharacterized protein n=1 Tax=Vespula maculifrons TaxID=7453 RepID=A0ABD2BZJ5_VESMC